MPPSRRFAIPLAGTLLALALLPTYASGAGLWDAGLLDGSWRSDFDAAWVGSAAQPLTYPAQCAFPSAEFAFCRGTYRPIAGLGLHPVATFPVTNWASHVTNTDGLFWLVGANVEPALDAHCNSGPPNQSEPVVAPFEGVFGVRVQPALDSQRPYQNEVVLAVDLSHRPRQLESRPDCITRDYIPYLGFGIASERGGGGQPLARLGHGPAPVLRFNYRLVDANAEFFDVGEPVPPTPRGQYAGLYVEAKWGGMRRWVWVDLINAHSRPSPSVQLPWNWGIVESFHFPGAEIVVTSGPTLQQECGSDGFDMPPTAPAVFATRQPLPFAIDLQRLYDCVGHRFSTPLATQPGPVEITGVHFFVEVGLRERDGLPGFSAIDYDSRFGVAIDSVDLVPASGTPFSSDAELVIQVGHDLLERDWTATEHARWLQFIATHGRVATVKAMLRHVDVERTLASAARIHLIAFGPLFDRPAFERSVARTREGASVPALASELAASSEFIARHGGRDDRAFVRELFRQALRGELNQQADLAAIEAAAGSVDYWSDALAAGRASRADVLLSVVRLASVRRLLQTEIDTIVLYRSFFRLLPDSSGVAGWRDAAPMPERLIEALYYAPPYRQRFMP
jgi:hypothetical protein